MSNRLACLLVAGLAMAPAAAGGSFTRAGSFRELDALLAPDGYAALLIASRDSTATLWLRSLLLEAVESIGEETPDFECSLFEVTPDDSGYATIVEVLGAEPPGVTAIVGTCGFINLEPDLLEADLRDVYDVWGAPGAARSSGICRFCDRCATAGPCALYRED
ncbi:hypothetical protein JW921_03350 [Candidatus Fermentibacterales bacterium]|nr:hypothetical protein [Candidatus Fermentibacterales bacterium]